MMNMNMCLFYRFSKLCKIVPLYSTLNDSRSVDYSYYYEKKVHSLFHHTLQLSVSFWKEIMTNP